MFVTAIGIIKDIDDSIIGYRLIDIDDNNKVLDVTKGQILNALRNKQITIENMELKGNKLVGTYYDIKLLPDIIGSNCDINVNIALLAKDGIVTVSNCIGNVCNIAVNKALSMPNIVNIINGDIKCVCENAYVTPSNKQAKFKMALYNTKYSVLLNDEYINNIEFLYKIILRLENNEYTNKEFILNTDKFLYRPLSDFRYLHGISGNKTDTLNYKFISLCNLLTTILDNDIRCFSDRFIHNMSKLSVIRSSTIYEDSNNSIFVTSAQVDRDLYNILYIVYNNNVVFQVPLELDYLKQTVSYKCKNFLFRLTNTLDDNNTSIAQDLDTGDTRVSNLTIRDITFPRQFLKDAMNSIRNTNFCYVGSLDEPIVATDRNKNNIHNKFKKLLFYDVHTQTFIGMSCSLSDHEDASAFNHFWIGLASITLFNVEFKVNLYNISKINKNYFNEWENAVKSPLMNNITRKLSMSASDIQKLYTKDNYDTTGNIQLKELAIKLYDLGISNIKDAKPSIIVDILKSDMCSKLNKSIKYCSKKFDNKKLYNIDTKYRLLEFTAGNRAIIGLITDESSMTDTSLLYYINSNINELIKHLYNMGALLKYNNTPMNGITNDTIHPDSLYYMHTTVLGDGIKLYVAFDTSNADCYIAGDWYDIDFFTLLRFKKYMDAYDEFSDSDKKYMLKYIIESLHSGFEPSEHDSFIWTLRKDIMSGLPNNFPYTKVGLELFNKLAKQPD